MSDKTINSFEVLSPWSEADAIPFRAINPRLTNLDGKTIGLLRNSKRAAQPMMNLIEAKLKAKFPNTKFTSFFNARPNEPLVEQPDVKPKFEDWLKGVDAVVAAVGD